MKNFSEFFFSIFFEVSDKSHSAEKCKRGTFWDFLNIHSVANYQKIDGRTLSSNEKIRKKMRNLNSLTVPKKGKSHSFEKGESLIVSKKVERGPFCFGMVFYLMLEALDALKIKH